MGYSKFVQNKSRIVTHWHYSNFFIFLLDRGKIGCPTPPNPDKPAIGGQAGKVTKVPKVDVCFLFDVGVFAYLDVRCSMFDVHLFPPQILNPFAKTSKT